MFGGFEAEEDGVYVRALLDSKVLAAASPPDCLLLGGAAETLCTVIAGLLCWIATDCHR